MVKDDCHIPAAGGMEISLGLPFCFYIVIFATWWKLVSVIHFCNISHLNIIPQTIIMARFARLSSHHDVHHPETVQSVLHSRYCWYELLAGCCVVSEHVVEGVWLGDRPAVWCWCWRPLTASQAYWSACSHLGDLRSYRPTCQLGQAPPDLPPS